MEATEADAKVIGLSDANNVPKILVIYSIGRPERDWVWDNTSICWGTKSIFAADARRMRLMRLEFSIPNTSRH